MSKLHPLSERDISKVPSNDLLRTFKQMIDEDLKFLFLETPDRGAWVSRSQVKSELSRRRLGLRNVLVR